MEQNLIVKYEKLRAIVNNITPDEARDPVMALLLERAHQLLDEFF
jgi:hypothetical protein